MLEQKKLSAESGLRARDALTKLFRRWIEQVAIEEWKSDIEQNLRISDVCEKLLPKVHHAKEKLIKRNVRSAKRLPSSKQKIREIIKDVAPPYASRPGAPRTPSSK